MKEIEDDDEKKGVQNIDDKKDKIFRNDIKIKDFDW